MIKFSQLLVLLLRMHYSIQNQQYNFNQGLSILELFSILYSLIILIHFYLLLFNCGFAYVFIEPSAMEELNT